MIALASAGLMYAAAAQAAVVGIDLECGYSCGSYAYASSDNGYVPGTIFGDSGFGQRSGGSATYGVGRAGRADFGTLGVAAASFVNNTGDGRPIVFNGALARAYSNDVITITSGSLAAGTLVPLDLEVRVHLISAPIDYRYGNLQFPALQTGIITSPTNAGNRLVAAVNAEGFGSICFDSDNPGLCTSLILPLPGESKYAGFKLTRMVRVGDLVPINLEFVAWSFHYNPGAFASGFSGSALHGLGTANFGLSFGGADVAAIASSGHDYSILAGAVPEPASWAMLIAGFGLVGALQRRRQPRRSFAA